VFRVAAFPAFRFVVFALALLATLGCDRTEEGSATEDIRRVVVLHLDTTRVDGIGCFGGIAKTPNIDGLCARGLHYTNAIAPTPRPSPSIAT
jgi:hypothetical protein